MQHLTERDYSARDLYIALENEAQKAVDYIDEVINDYNGTAHENEYFRDVILFDDVDFPVEPRNGLRISTRGRRGIYVFIVKTDFSLTRQEVAQYNKCAGAGFSKKYGAKELKMGDHFYQGSACNSLLVRFHQHYSIDCQASAMKLNNPNRLMVKDKLKLYIFPMVPGLEFRHFFIEMIEEILHKRFPPITGGTRV